MSETNTNASTETEAKAEPQTAEPQKQTQADQNAEKLSTYETALRKIFKLADGEELGDIDGKLTELEAEHEKLISATKDKLITASYNLLGLISYLTTGPDESRAWTIERGTKAPQAAGKIHTDFERGFIRAEVVSYDNLVEQGSENAAKEKGLVRSEGKDYVVQDGDVILFRFNV